MKHLAVAVLIAILVILGGSFALPHSTMASIPTRTSSATPAVSYHVEVDYFSATSLNKVIKYSDIVVIGQISNTNTWVNLSRDLNNITEPRKVWLTVGQVYRVDVERYLMGSGGSNVIYFVQAEGSVSIFETKTPDAIQTARAADPYRVPKPNTRYMLFLSATRSLPHYCAGAIEPWRFDLSNPAGVIPESPMRGLDEYFPPTPLSAFMQQVQELIATASATPASSSMGEGAVPSVLPPCSGAGERLTLTRDSRPLATITAQPSR